MEKGQGTLQIQLCDGGEQTQRIKTKEGYLIAPAIISRLGIFDFTKAELGFHDEQGICKVARVDQSLFSDVTVKSFEGMPITIGHPQEEVSSQNWKQYAVGTIRNVRRDGDYLRADVAIYDQEAVNLIEKQGIRELSCGYRSQILETSVAGADFELSPMVGNHVALVASGRCGYVAKLADGDITMDNEEKMNVSDEQGQGKASVAQNEPSQAEEKTATSSTSEKEEAKPVNASDKEVALLGEIAALRKELNEIKEQHKKELERQKTLGDAKSVFNEVVFSDGDSEKDIYTKAILADGNLDAHDLEGVDTAGLKTLFMMSKKMRQKNKVSKAFGDSTAQESPRNFDFTQAYKGV